MNGPAGEVAALPGPARAAVRALRLFTFPVFLGALLVAGVAATVRMNLESALDRPSASPPNSIIEGDTWWHLTTGERILQTRTWPRHETDSFTARGGEWIAYEWLGEVAMAVAYRLGGLRALAVLLVVLASAVLVLTYYAAWLRTGSAEAAFLGCALLFPLFSVSFSVRPQLFGYIFFLITLIALEQFRAGRLRHLWLLPGIFVLWANTHATFLYGWLLLALYLAAGSIRFSAGVLRAEPWKPSERRHLAGVMLACIGASLLNPYGWRLGRYLLYAGLQPLNFANIQEWRPASFHEFYGWAFLVLLLAFVVALGALRPSYRLEEFAALAGSAWAACRHLRFSILFAIIFAPMLAGLLARWVDGAKRDAERYFLNAALVALLAVGVVELVPSRALLDRLVARCFPAGAVEYLLAHPIEQNMFNEFFWGAYLTRQLGLGHPVFIDGRVDAYEPSGVFADYLQIARVEGDPQPLLRKYAVGACLISPSSPLANYLANSPQWQKVYSDQVSVLFVRAGKDAGKAAQ